MLKKLLIGVLALVATSACNTGAQPHNLQGDSTVNPLLAELLRAHGVESTTRDGWILVDDAPSICGAVVQEIQQTPDVIIVQIDTYVRIESGRILIESFGGFGQTKEEAIASGIQNFIVNSFHVFLAAFYGETDDQVETEDWAINGKERRVVIGNFGLRGNLPNPDEMPVEWFAVLESQIKTADLSSGTHWVRCYYAQMENQTTEVEVLLNNDDWRSVRSKMSKVNWPKGESFYSVRVFLVIQD